MSDDHTTALAEREQDDHAITRPDVEQARAALLHLTATGDVSKMSDAQRAAFILHYCRSVGLNPATGAVEIIEFYDPETKGRVAKVYPKAEAAKQLGDLHRIRVETLSEEIIGNRYYKVTVRGTQPDGRCYDEVGYVPVTDRDGKPLVGTRYTNALMKCHTVAKRRLILGMVGLSAPPSEDEQAGIKRRYLGPHGELLDAPTEADRYLNDHPAVAAISGRPRFESLPASAPTGLEDMPDQRPRPEDLHAPTRTSGERPMLRTTDAQITTWRATFHATVKGSSLAATDERHRFVGQYTASEGWPTGKQTTSLSTFLARATEAEAEEFLLHVRALVDDERRANEEALAEHNRGDGQAEAGHAEAF